MKKQIFTLLLTCAIASAFAQDETKTVKQFYTEMGGPGVLFSANFDTRFNASSHLGLGIRFGLGFTISDNNVDTNGNNQVRSVGTMPIGINYLLGKSNSPHTFEIGAGTTILFTKISMLNWYGNDKKGNFLGFASFMYRRQPLNGGFSWRIGFTPMISTGGDIVPFAAAGIGYAFK